MKSLRNQLKNVTDIPFHFKIGIDEITYRYNGELGLRKLAVFVSEILAVPSFVLDQNDNLFVVGLAKLLNYSRFEDFEDFGAVLKFFGDSKELLAVFERSFSLFPVFVAESIELERRTLENIILVTNEIKIADIDGFFSRARIGILGPPEINIELAVSVLEYIGSIQTRIFPV